MSFLHHIRLLCILCALYGPLALLSGTHTALAGLEGEAVYPYWRC